jgi:peptidoglycan/LPS O-acetylase OafA/YrhL
MRPQKSEKQVIPGLDIVRFIAAFMVMSFHLCTGTWAAENAIPCKIVAGRAAFPELFSVTWFGWLGVEIFFVISGFVIAYSADGASALAFLRRRALRLYPAAWVCATITAVTVLALGIETNRVLLHQWLDSVVLFPLAPWVDPVYWTLGIEIAFYSLIFVLLAIRQFSQLERVATILGMLSSAYWILGTLVAPHFLQTHLFDRTLQLSLVPYGCFFILGVLTYVVFRAGPSLIRVLAMILLTSAGVTEVRYTTVHENSIFSWNQTALVPQILFVAGVLAIITSILSTCHSCHRSFRLVRILGLATYPLYLFHQIVGAAIMKLVLIAGGGKYTALALAICLCVSASIAIAVFIEPPIRTLLRGFPTRITNTILGPPTSSEVLPALGKRKDGEMTPKRRVPRRSCF